MLLQPFGKAAKSTAWKSQLAIQVMDAPVIRYVQRIPIRLALVAAQLVHPGNRRYITHEVI